MWFETIPLNITAPVGYQTSYMFPNLIINEGSFNNYSLIYSSTSITASLATNGISSVLILDPSANQRGIHHFRIALSNNEGNPDV